MDSIIDIEVKPSLTLLYVTIALHVGSFASALVVLNDWTQLGLACLILAFNFIRLLRVWDASSTGLRTLKTLRFKEGTLCEITALDGRQIDILELRNARAWPWLVQLTLRDEDQLHVHLVPSDSVDDEDWWKLRVNLQRIEGKIAR